MQRIAIKFNGRGKKRMHFAPFISLSLLASIKLKEKEDARIHLKRKKELPRRFFLFLQNRRRKKRKTKRGN